MRGVSVSFYHESVRFKVSQFGDVASEQRRVIFHLPLRGLMLRCLLIRGHDDRS